MRLSDFFISSHSMPMATSSRHRMPTKATMVTLSSNELSAGLDSAAEAEGSLSLI